MKVIYPQETLDLLAECDKHLEAIKQEYLRPIEEEKARWPRNPEYREMMLADPVYQHYFYEMAKRQQHGLMEDPFYRGLIHLKARIIGVSTCTYQFEASEVRQWTERE